MKSSFTVGCADFLKDPWYPEELYYRANRCVSIRRISVNGTSLEFRGLTVSSQEKGSIFLTYQESVILRTLARQQGKVLSREVLGYFLGIQNKEGSRVIDVHISSLRKKIGELLPCSGSFNPIRSVRGIGYILQ